MRTAIRLMGGIHMSNNTAEKREVLLEVEDLKTYFPIKAGFFKER